MADRHDFEGRLARAMEAYTAPVETPFDAAAIARGARRSARRWLPLGRPAPASGGLLSPVVILLLAMILAATVAVGVGSGLLRPPSTSDKSVVPPAEVDACALLGAAVEGNRRELVYLPTIPGRDSQTNRGHDEQARTWGAKTCAWGWDGSYEAPHLFVRASATSADEAGAALEAFRASLAEQAGSAEWAPLPTGEWRLAVDDGDRGKWVAVAVLAEPYFFIVTARELGDAYLLAEATAAGVGLGDLVLDAP